MIQNIVQESLTMILKRFMYIGILALVSMVAGTRSQNVSAYHDPGEGESTPPKASSPAADQKTSAWPMVEITQTQPLHVQLQRLVETLDYIGNPLSDVQKSELKSLISETDAKRVTQRVQEIFDPLCLAAVEIHPGRFSTIAHPGTQELIHKGWRSYLIKVCNHADLRSRLSVESPNARPLPHAKAEDVSDRWMTLSMYDRRPMQTDLSGLDLEYRIIQIYSRDDGPKKASLEFSVDLKTGKPGRHIRQWRFNKDSDGWKALNDTEIEVRNGAMFVSGTGSDPFIGAEVGNATGDILLRFRAETEDDGVAQIFWWTEERPEPDGARTINLPLIPKGAHQYEVVIPVRGVLAGVRIDPNIKPTKTRFDWIDLMYARRQGETWNQVPLNFNVKKSIPVTLNVKDKPGIPAVAAFEIRDRWGRVYPEQTKRLAPDLFFHPQIYRRNGETIYLPPGTYTFKCWRGPHSIPETRIIEVAGETMTVDFKVARWFDPTQYHWWAGDHHIHAAGCLHYVNPTEGVNPGDMLRQIMGEDLNIGCCLNWGPSFDFQKQFFTGKVDRVSEYPYLLRYDVEVSGFGSHASGHLNLLRLNDQIYPGGDSKHHWPTLGLNTLKWAKKQGAICGPAHSGNGLVNIAGRLEGYQDGPHGLPHYNIPRFDGIGACEYIVDVTHKLPGPDGKLVPAIDFISTMDTPRRAEWNMWYHSLNCGFRVRASGETDFPCMSGERVGIGRVYVQVKNRLNYEDWIQGVQDGRSYVSDGKAHIIDFQARPAGANEFLAIGDQNSEIRSNDELLLELRAKCAALMNFDELKSGNFSEVEVELIVNGHPVETKSIVANGSLQDVTFQTKVSQSSWVALRIFPHAHSNPFFTVIGEKPIRVSKASAEWSLRCVEQCWKQKQPTYAEVEQAEAKAAYEHARRVYRKIIEECEVSRP